MPFYSCGRLGASKERPLECSGIGGIAPRGFSAASDSLSFFCAWRCGLCGKSWSLRFPARLLRSSKQDPRRGLPARRGSLGVTGRYVAADGNVALSRRLVAPATCQSEEARARCDQAREPRRIAVTDGRSLFLIGRYAIATITMPKASSIPSPIGAPINKLASISRLPVATHRGSCAI